MFCDRLILPDRGHIAAAGTPADVMFPEVLKAVYGAEVMVEPHPATGRPHVVPLGTAARSPAGS